MSYISDFYHGHAYMRDIFSKLDAVYKKLNPKRPHARHRMVGLSKDLLATSQLCFEAFTDCMPFAVHMELDAPKMLPVDLLLERQELAKRKCNDLDSLKPEEEMRLLDLEKVFSEHGEAIVKAFSGNSSDEFEKRRQDTEARLISCVRAFAFSCRSYHDAIYALFLISRGEKATGNSSMAKIENKANPLRKELGEDSEYVLWFTHFRDLRNLIKEGTTASVSLSIRNICVSFDDARDNRVVKVGGNTFALANLSQALKMSAEVTELTIQAAITDH